MKTPRRARMRQGRTEHTSNPWHGPQYFRLVEALRLESIGRWTGNHYGWRMVDAVEVAA